MTLSVVGPALAGQSPGDVYFYPYDDKLIDQGKPEAVELGAKGLTLTMTPGAAFAPPSPAPTKVAGVLVADGKAYEISAAAGPAAAGTAGLGPPKAANDGVGPSLAAGAGMGLALAAGAAFLGGLILNLMPCVFPILSMKAAALAGHASMRAGRVQGLAFLGGVLASFLAVAAALLAARTAGTALGWGFQLQSLRCGRRPGPGDAGRGPQSFRSL